MWTGHVGLALLLAALAVFGTEWMANLGDTLFKDRVVHRLQTPYQNVVITKRHVAAGKPDVLSLYINGALQFASNDERIYHAPPPPRRRCWPLTAADRVLVLGGGDGLALRDILRWQPRSVTLVDIDPQLLRLFRGDGDGGGDGDEERAPAWLSRALLALNHGALADPRVQIIEGDAFIEVERLAALGERFDVVIADLPDPNHPDLDRLYSDYFYVRVRQLLSPDGAFVTQSTSAYHAKSAFLSIGKTLAHAGFDVEQYHANVPSFGEWGFSIGTVASKGGRGGRPASVRIAAAQAAIPDGWLDKEQIAAAFVFPVGFYDEAPDIRINRLGNHVVYNYHQQAWQRDRGVFFAAEVSH